MFLVFENEGTLIREAVTMMGVSAKVGNNPIGQFGTGLKYAIAVAARENRAMFVQFGDGYTYRVKSSTIELRNKNFNSINLERADAEEDEHTLIKLPFTTDYGRNWTIEHAFRELESNCRDEKGNSYESIDVPDAVANTVRIAVGGFNVGDLRKLLQATFFNHDRLPMVSNVFGDIIRRPSNVVYYRGIAAFKLNKPSRLTYNLRAAHHLTEDRSISSAWSVADSVQSLLMYSSDADIIEQAIRVRPQKSHYEDELLFEDNWCYVSLGQGAYKEAEGPDTQVFRQVATKLYDKSPGSVHNSIAVAIEKLRSSRERFRRAENIEDRYVEMLEDAYAACARMGFGIPQDDVVVSDKMEDLYGMVHDGKIFISMRAFEMGLDTVIATLIEEYAHHTHQYADFTREMQDWMLRQIVRLGMRKRS